MTSAPASTSAVPTEPRPLMNLKEAADYLRVSTRLVETLCASRRIRPAKVNRRLIFKRAELDRFIDLQIALA